MTKKLFYVLSFAILLLLSGCTMEGLSSTPSTGGQGGAPANSSLQAFICSQGAADSDFWTTWVPFWPLAIVASIMLLTFLYMFSYFFKTDTIRSFVKLELFEVFASVIIVGSFIAAMVPMCSLTLGAVFPSITDPAISSLGFYDTTEKYFTSITDKIEGWMHVNYALNLWLDQLASITPYSRPLGVGIVATPGAGFAAPLKQMIYNVFTSLAIALIINIAQLNVLKFAIAACLKYYLPIGIFLRCFTPTRRFGGTLIALAIGFMLLYPLYVNASYIMLFTTSDSIINVYDNNINNFASVTIYGLTAHTVDSKADSLKEQSKNTGDIIFDFFKNVTVGFLDMIGKLISVAFGAAVTTAFLIPMATVGMGLVIGYLLPAFQVLLFVQSVKYLSKTLGEEIDVNSLTRLI
ncbi:MAG: hypothetical protein Q7S22_05665 [Candidatus Micrarchaeota archaeon]|nr:hypothetical protein [Candidatus Micrarchaeota archaeon]